MKVKELCFDSWLLSFSSIKILKAMVFWKQKFPMLQSLERQVYLEFTSQYDYFPFSQLALLTQNWKEKWKSLSLNLSSKFSFHFQLACFQNEKMRLSSISQVLLFVHQYSFLSYLHSKQTSSKYFIVFLKPLSTSIQTF